MFLIVTIADVFILPPFANLLFKKIFYSFFRERGKEGEKEGEKHLYVREASMVAFLKPLARDLVHNPGMCPSWESNQQPFSWQASAQPTEPHKAGLANLFL